MKRMLILMLITSCLGLCGCATAQQHLAHFRQDVERSNKTAETIFDYSYKDVFMAIVQVCNDTVTTIYTKDFERGIILGKNDLGNALGDFQKPSHNFGFWLKDLGNNKTKVTLRMVEPQWPMGGTAEDEFNLIKKELEMRAKFKDSKKSLSNY